MAKCAQCGTESASKFCPNCGAQVQQTPPVAAAAQAPQYPPQQPVPPQYPPQGYAPQVPPQAPPQYQQPYPGYQAPPQKKSSAGKIIAIVVGVVVVVAALLFAALAALGDKVEDLAGTPTKVTTSVVKNVPVITDKVNETSQAPIGELKTVPPKTGLIYAAVQVEVKQGDVLGAKWYYKGKLQDHLNTDLPVDEDFRGWASFNIDNGGDPWPVAQYKVEIYLNGKLVQEKAFEVK